MSAASATGRSQPSGVQALKDHLRDRGATEREIEAHERAGMLTPLAVDLTVAPRTDTPDASGSVDVDLAREAFLALGFGPVPDHLRSTDAQLLSAFAAACDLLGERPALHLFRSLGIAGANIASAIVDAARVAFEAPARRRGATESKIAHVYEELARTQLPAITEVFDTVMRRRISAEARNTWQADTTALVIDTTIGFADLVGYSDIVRSLSMPDLAALLDDFEAAVARRAASHGARIVKFVGDAVMYACTDPADACAVAHELLDFTDRSLRLPALRIGLANGAVLARGGDYFGATVNLSARLAESAEPGTALATAEIGSETHLGYEFEVAEPRRLAGFTDPVTPRRLLGSRGDPGQSSVP